MPIRLVQLSIIGGAELFRLTQFVNYVAAMLGFEGFQPTLALLAGGNPSSQFNTVAASAARSTDQRADQFETPQPEQKATGGRSPSLQCRHSDVCSLETAADLVQIHRAWQPGGTDTHSSASRIAMVGWFWPSAGAVTNGHRGLIKDGADGIVLSAG